MERKEKNVGLEGRSRLSADDIVISLLLHNGTRTQTEVNTHLFKGLYKISSLLDFLLRKKESRWGPDLPDLTSTFHLILEVETTEAGIWACSCDRWGGKETETTSASTPCPGPIALFLYFTGTAKSLCVSPASPFRALPSQSFSKIFNMNHVGKG